MNPLATHARWAVPAIVILAAGGLGYWHWTRTPPPVAAQPVVAAQASLPEAAPAPEPAIQHQLPAAPAEEAEALPQVDASDMPIKESLQLLAGESAVADWLVPEGIARRFVATVDNLSRPKVAERLRPLNPVSGPLIVQRQTVDAAAGQERITLLPDNYGRYDAAMRVLGALDMQQVAKVYRHYYPLFQRAYEDLGYPGRYFNDRVVATIDHLLATQLPEGPIELTQPKVMYEFADPAIEARSAGQKLLIRMGPAHAELVKKQLAALRGFIAQSPASPASAPVKR
jgi:Protein of unknown function (DUF3014)